MTGAGLDIDGRLEEMSSEQHVVATAIEHWTIAKPALYRLDVQLEDFGDPWDRATMEAIFTIDLRDGVVSLDAVLAELARLGLLSAFTAVGGAHRYLALLTHSLITPSSVGYHVRQLLDAACRRQIAHSAADVSGAAREGDDFDLDAALSRLRGAVIRRDGVGL